MEVNANEAAEEQVVQPEAPQVDDAAAEVDVTEHPEMKALVASFSKAADDTEVKPEAEAEAPEPEVVGKEAPAAEGTEAEEAEESWITDSDRRYSAALGLSAEELADFSSRDELDRFGRFLAARKEPEVAKVAKAVETKPAEYVDQPLLADGSLNVEWFKEHEYDEGQIAMAQAAADKAKKLEEVEQKFEGLQGYIAEQQRHRDINDFHDALDSIDGEFFGKTIVKDAAGHEKPVVISEKLGARRQAVFAQLDVANESLTRRLGHAPTMSQKVELASRLAWEAELVDASAKRTAAAEKGKLTKIVKQAQRVRTVGSQAAATGRAKNVDPDSVEYVTSAPEFQALLAKFNEHNAN